MQLSYWRRKIIYKFAFSKVNSLIEWYQKGKRKKKKDIWNWGGHEFEAFGGVEGW